MTKAGKSIPSLEKLTEGVLSGDRILLSRAITLVESNLPEDQEMAGKLMDNILSSTGNSHRIGITGVPGVGKSTFIEAFGLMLVEKGKKVAVLTIDPSSQVSKGSILGDKTRMERLSVHPNAYIRPSASGQALGGVSNRTREAMLLCEAAGFDLIIVETVGVGQSETAVFGMVDFFLLLMLAGAGDELQGMKRGIMEMADAISITKADGNNIERSRISQSEFKSALHLMPPKASGWTPKVNLSSALQNQGMDEIWEMIESHRNMLEENGSFEKIRETQNISWFNDLLSWELNQAFLGHPSVKDTRNTLEKEVLEGKVAASSAARSLIKLCLSLNS